MPKYRGAQHRVRQHVLDFGNGGFEADAWINQQFLEASSPTHKLV
jgi:hypothetical protein